MDIEQLLAVRTAYRIHPIEVAEGGVVVCGVMLAGVSLTKHLAGCSECAVMAVTLGMDVDRMMRRLQVIDMGQAVRLDGDANRYIEDICDSLQREITVDAHERGLYVTTRFSPGYGDLALGYQRDLLRLSGADKTTGITATSSNLLVPQKSVTAIIGLGACRPAKANLCDECSISDRCTKIRCQYEKI